MPLLDNPRHEIFAQQLAQGKTADEAYALAGYRKSRSNASVLRTNQNISTGSLSFSTRRLRVPRSPSRDSFAKPQKSSGPQWRAASVRRLFRR